jgi:hypothetical protein
MRKIAHPTVLTALSTLLGLVPLTAFAQITPNQIIICSKLTEQSSFKLNGKGEVLKPNQCRTFSGSTTFSFYTEYGDGTGARYSLRRELKSGDRYKFEQTSNPPKRRLDIKLDPIIPT